MDVQVGQATVCDASTHDGAGAAVGVHAARCAGGLGRQFPLPVGCLRRLPASSAALVLP